jgi:hypothetical protein
MTGWPSSTAYTIAIQNPQACFRDADLRSARVARLLTGMPKVWTGNYAQVYELEGDSGRWAVKCFTRSARDVRDRYRHVAAALARSHLPCFVDFDFLDDEMLVGGARHPVVKMRWAEGQPLDQFVASSLHRPRALLVMAARLLSLVRELERHRLAHGDLQHGNVVITRTGVTLVDYDGMFVPTFAGSHAPEAGLPCYQHPARSAADYGVGLDRFSTLVICTASAALAADPGLWDEFGTGDNLLFTSDDFRDPQQSRLFQKLRASDEPDVRALAASLEAACAQRPLDVRLPDLPVTFMGTSRRDFFRVGGSNGDGALAAAARWLNRTYRIRVNMRVWNARG